MFRRSCSLGAPIACTDLTISTSSHAASSGARAFAGANTSGLTARKYINRACGMPERLHSETEGGRTSQSRATSAVPPKRSMILFASMAPIIGAPNGYAQGGPNSDLLRLTYMSTLAERVALAMRKSGVSQAELARAVGIKPPSVNNWLSGATKELKGNSTTRAARAMGVSAHWLATGKGPMSPDDDPEASDIPEDYEAIRRVEFKLSAGSTGFEVEYLNGDSPPIFFRKDWLKTRGFRADSLFAVAVSGASMEPGLYDADIVVVNTLDIREQDGEVYAINFEGELLIKRLVRDEGQWWICSDNADQRRYPRKRCGERVILLGRVVHKQSERI